MAKRMLMYRQDFLALGFIEIKDRFDVPRPQCVVCMQVLSNESLKLNKLRRHLERVHPTYVNKPLAFWKEKSKTQKTQVKRVKLEKPSSSASVSLEKNTFASFEVALKVAQSKKPHSIAQELIKPAAIAMVRTVCGDEIAKKLEMVPISNDTVKKRIKLMSLDILEQLIADLKAAIKFSIQIDESVDVDDFPQLLVYVRYRTAQNFNDEFLFCEKLSVTSTGADFFFLVDKFFEHHQLQWQNCVAICMDGAPAMVGFCAKVKERNPEVVTIPCFLHRENLATQNMQPDLHCVLKDVIQIINFIKARALNSRIFEVLCEEMGSEHQHLLYHSEFRWLSRRKILARILSLKTEIEIFLTDKKHECANRFSDNKWMAKLAYLSDIFDHLNQLNTEMQGQNRTVVDIYENITVFKNKTKLWQDKIANHQLAAFATLNLFLEDLNDSHVFLETTPIFLEHLRNLENEMARYIPQNVHIEKYSWIRNPFEVDVMGIENDTAGLQEELLELQGDGVLKDRFARMSLTKFWAELSGKPILSIEAEKALLPFPTIHLCETGFSCLAVLKNKYRNRVDPQHDMRCALSINLTPRINLLCSKIQHQGSH